MAIDSLIIPRPSEFHLGTANFPETNILVQTVRYGDIELTNHALKIFYTEDLCTRINFDNVFDSSLLGVQDKEIEVLDTSMTEDVKLFPVKRKFKSSGESIFHACPRVTPIRVNFGKNPERVSGLMVRCPELFSNSVMLILENRSIRFKFSPFERNAACENQSDSPDIFGLFEAESSLGQDDCWEELMRLETFLTFTRGAKCGFGHVCGHSSDGSIAFAWIGFSSFDLNQPLLGWYDWSLQNELPNIFSQFCEIPMDSLLYKAIHHSIYYYRSSNVARSDYLEMAIIASHAALEVLVHYILEERAGWSSEMMKGKLKSADMLRAACHFCGVTAEPLEHSVELLKIAKNRSIDGYELVHTIRNRLVHASKAPEFEGRALLESWTVSQWMVELLIFYLIGYRGKMADRREISRWKGTTVDVPLT